MFYNLDMGGNTNVIFVLLPTGFKMYLGDKPIIKMYLGSKDVTNVYLGNKAV